MSSVRLEDMACDLRTLLAGLDPLVWDGPMAKDYVRQFSAIERLAANGRLLAMRRMAETNATEKDAARDPSDWVANETRTSPGKTKRDAQTAASVADGSVTELALRDGSISADHAEAIGRVKNLDASLEAELVDAAQTESFAKFKQLVQQLQAGAEDAKTRAARQKKLCGIRRWHDEDGMRRIMAIMTPEQAASFEPILDAFIEAQFANARREGRRDPAGVYAVEGLVELARLANEHIHHACPTAERVATNNTTRNGDGDGDGDGNGDGDGDGNGVATNDTTRNGDGDGDDGSGITPTGGGTPNGSAPATPGTPASAPVSGTGAKRRNDPRINIRALLLVDLTALRRGDTLPGERCEIAGVGPVNVAYARSLLGDAAVDILIRDGIDVKTVAHAGRSPNRTQKSALLADMQCEIRGCTHTRRLEIDHINPYAETRWTEIESLGPKCDHHHYLKTHKGWTDGPRGPEGKRDLYPPGHQPPDPPANPNPPELFPN